MESSPGLEEVEPELSEDLDTSWIENEKFRDVYEREHMNEVVLFFVYMDRHMVIEKIIKDYIDIYDEDDDEDDCGSISKEKLLHIIQTRRHRPDVVVKYKFMDLLAFHVPLEPHELEGFIKEDDIGRFMKSLPIFDPVLVDPSIFIFHDLNSLFFFFKEAENPVRSILKNGENGSHRITKKVRLDAVDYVDKKRKSMKRLMKSSLRGTRKMVSSLLEK